MKLSRRYFISGVAASTMMPHAGRAATPLMVAWDDLIPPGVPYAEIIGDGEIDPVRDTWLPVFDDNATKLNDALDGAYIKMPGYMLPIDMSAQGVTSFIMVPYVGACIHVPPPPANQLVFVECKTPWPSESMWDPVWVTGLMSHELQSTTVADIGYALAADKIEAFEW
ncbi:MAG: DUF3299 domain-containing protein [Roseobacter sp.]